MLQTTSFLIEEGRKLKKIYIPVEYIYMENHYCPRCKSESVYGYWRENDAQGLSGEFICAACGKKRSIV
jgi:transposase-like protein